MQFTEMIVNIHVFPGVNCLQDVMNTFYHETSAAEMGTLFHLKNVFGHRSAKKDLGETADFWKWLCPLGCIGVVWDGTLTVLNREFKGTFI